MSFVAAAVSIGGVAGAAASYLGATQASKAQIGAETQALSVQNTARSYLNPFINVGTQAANTLGTLTGGTDAHGRAVQPNYAPFTSSPDYQFAQQQGNAALQNYLNANGMALSGAGLTAALNYNQGLASQQYGNYFNRLMQIATLGNNAASAGVGGANAAANTIGNIGASQASGIVGGANAISGGIGGTLNNALLYNAINRGGNPSGYGMASSPYPNFADLGMGGGVGTGGYNFLDAAAR